MSCHLFAAEVVAAVSCSRACMSQLELRFFFDNEDHVGRWVAKLGFGDATLLQTARVRSAWSAVRLYFQQAEQDRSKVTLADLDSILGDSELRDFKTAFWQRYKLRFPAEVHPSDMVVSRVSRELSKRMLCVFNICEVKNLQFQLTTVQKKRKLGDNLYTEETETDEHVSKDAETYLDKLYILMLAYAIAGAAPFAGVGPNQGEDLGSQLYGLCGGPARCGLGVLVPS